MKGLILKDIINMKMYGKSMLILILFFGVTGAFQGSTATALPMLGSMSVVLTMIVTINTFSFDAAAKWDGYALSMPIRRKDVVASKYLLFIGISVVLVAFFTLCAAVLNLFSPIEDFAGQLLTMAASTAATWLILSVMLPLLYKFGVEKSRILLIVVALIPTFVIMGATQLNISLPDIPSIPQSNWLFFIIPAVILLIVWISDSISVSIFAKKDL